MSALDVSAHADAFSLLSHDDRLATVVAMFTAECEWVPFSTLRERVDVRDTGRFRYHLSRLRPRLVEQSTDGYRLTRRGRRAARVMHRGTLTADPTTRTVSLPEDCVRCAGGLVLSYAEQFGTVTCEDCGRWFVRYLLPPGTTASSDADDLPAKLDTRCRELRHAGNRGVCSLCTGEMAARLVPESEQYGHPGHVHYDCANCECEFTSTVGAAHAEHAAITAFCYEHGEDPAATPLWALDFAFDPECLSVTEDPEPRAELAIERAADELVVSVGPDAGVERVERR